MEPVSWQAATAGEEKTPETPPPPPADAPAAEEAAANEAAASTGVAEASEAATAKAEEALPDIPIVLICGKHTQGANDVRSHKDYVPSTLSQTYPYAALCGSGVHERRRV